MKNWMSVEGSGPRGTRLWLPDIASMVRERLENTGELKEEHNFSDIGRLVTRQLSDTRGGTGSMRLSEAGKCIRARAYSLHHWEKNGHGRDAGSSITFAIGDITEAFLVAATREALSGNDNVVLKNAGAGQKEVYLDIPINENRTARILGHPDGTMHIKNPDSWESQHPTINAIFELKSMSDYGFKMFRKNGLSNSDPYYAQIQAYMLAETIMTEAPCNWAYVMAFGKSSSGMEAHINNDGEWWKLFPLIGQWIPADRDFQEGIFADYQRLLTSTDVEQFPRPHGPAIKGKNKGKLRFPCSYCAYYKHCFPGSYQVAEESKWLQKVDKIQVVVPEGGSN